MSGMRWIDWLRFRVMQGVWDETETILESTERADAVRRKDYVGN